MRLSCAADKKYLYSKTICDIVTDAAEQEKLFGCIKTNKYRQMRMVVRLFP